MDIANVDINSATDINTGNNSAESGISPSTPRSSPEVGTGETLTQNGSGVGDDRWIEVNAEDLMDELFGEVEHILETGTVPDHRAEQAEFVAIKPLPVPISQIQVPAVLSSSSGGAEVEVIEVKSQSGRWFDRTLMASVLVAMTATVSLWSFRPHLYGGFFAPLVGLEWPEDSTASSLALLTAAQAEQDRQFVQYLQRSIRLTEQKQDHLAQATTTGPNGALPAVALASNPGDHTASGLPLANASVVERVYIPIYQAPPTASASLALPGLSTPGLSPSALPSTAANTTNTVASPIPTVEVPAIPTNGEPLPTNGGPADPEPVDLEPANGVATAIGQSPLPIAATTSHTLVGILELGQRSAALFEVNGVTRRIHLGEGIGGSGWSLVEVVNQEAILRRNGEVRSVYVGQSF
jgi:hypothetical protein